MSSNKTIPTSEDVATYLTGVQDEKRRSDAEELVKLMAEATGAQPVMWGTSIVGFGKYHYVYETGREGDTVAVGFSARKNALALYGIVHYDQNAEESKKLGAATLGKGCLYIKDLAKINMKVLADMIASAFQGRNNS